MPCVLSVVCHVLIVSFIIAFSWTSIQGMPHTSSLLSFICAFITIMLQCTIIRSYILFCTIYFFFSSSSFSSAFFKSACTLRLSSFTSTLVYMHFLTRKSSGPVPDIMQSIMQCSSFSTILALITSILLSFLTHLLSRSNLHSDTSYDSPRRSGGAL